MTPSKLDKAQVVKVLKTAAYIGAAAALDALIASTTGTTFGTLTPVINLALVLIKQVFTKAQ
jgi:hypothetical protein